METSKRHMIYYLALCAPLVYQLTILYSEFAQSITPNVFLGEPIFIDLPSVTLCVPLPFALKRTFWEQLSLDGSNSCAAIRESILFGNAPITDVQLWNDC